MKYFRLTGSTKSKLFEGLDEDVLPKTFLDAIAVARRLRVGYLWIDSLCIFQDSKSDWQAESSRMGDVYSGSFCNIAATAATNPAGGIFCQNLERRLTAAACIVKAKQSIFSRRKSCLLYNEGFWTQETDGLPLLTRGWVIQERILAPRTIHFTKCQVFWECSHTVACETFPRGLPLPVFATDVSLRWKQRLPFAITDLSPWWRRKEKIIKRPSELGQEEHDAPSTWKLFVEAYTRCELTKEWDKLPALAGIVKLMRPLFQCRYLAGLWEKNFLHQLLWYVSGSKSRRPTYRAPSWSWASVDGPIEYPDFWNDTNFVGVTLVDVQLKYVKLEGVPDDDTLEVSGGYIQVEAPLVLVRSLRCDSDYSTAHSKFNLNKAEIGGRTVSVSVNLDIETEDLGTFQHFLPLRRDWRGSVAGLLLRPAGRPKTGFQRLGRMDIRDSSDIRIVGDKKGRAGCSYCSKRVAYFPTQNERSGIKMNLTTIRII